jgi:uroporphyrinogen-III synthase
VVASLRDQVKGARVLLVRAKVARDVIPRELQGAGARVDVVEAYETVVPESSRSELAAVLRDPQRKPHVIPFTSSSSVTNFIELLGKDHANATLLRDVKLASIGPVTSTTLRELSLPVAVEAREFTIPGMVEAIVKAV